MREPEIDNAVQLLEKFCRHHHRPVGERLSRRGASSLIKRRPSGRTGRLSGRLSFFSPSFHLPPVHSPVYLAHSRTNSPIAGNPLCLRAHLSSDRYKVIFTNLDLGCIPLDYFAAAAAAASAVAAAVAAALHSTAVAAAAAFWPSSASESALPPER